MVGNVYAKFADEEAAAKALQALQGRFYAGRPILAEFSPVTDFREATCRQFEENTCARGGYCNFMHLKNISRELRKQLFGRYRRRSPRRRRRERSRSRSRSRGRRHSRSPPRDRRRHRQNPAFSVFCFECCNRESSRERRSRIAEWNREKNDDGEENGNESSPKAKTEAKEDHPRSERDQ